jgi:hypothetical protein
MGVPYMANDKMTPVEVEVALVRHYLHTEGPSGAAPLRYIDASDAELQEAFGAASAPQAVEILLAGCGGEKRVADVLEQGWHGGWPDRETPGFLRFLILTCAVVASADSNPDTHDFGKNLQSLFGTRRSFGQRSGLPRMWQDLNSWCNARHAKGDSIREVRLPKPGMGKHIGLTNAISFPNWRDVLRLRSEFELRSGLAASIRTPQDAARNVCQLIRQETGHEWEMVEAAREFHSLYMSQASLLYLHRFWLVVCRAARLTRRRQPTISSSVRIELVFGVSSPDTALRFSFVGSDGLELDSPYPAFIDQVEHAIAQLRGWLNASAQRWLEMFNAGAVAFVQEGFGVWVASDRKPDGMAEILFLAKTHRLSLLKEPLPCKIKNVTTQWSLVGPIEPKHATAVHRALGISLPPEVKDELPIRVDGGVKTKAGWLGRLLTLPRVIREGHGELSLRSTEEASPSARLEQIDRTRFRVVSDDPLDGLYRLKLEERAGGVGVLAVETGIRFTANAPEHPAIVQPSARWLPQPEFVEAACVVQERPIVVDPRGVIKLLEGSSEGFNDLLEIIYALGRVGWSESELVATIRDLVPGPSPWDVIRGLHETGWMERRVHETWRASSWWLVQPCLVAIPTQNGIIGMLGGSAPEIVRHRFEATARKLGFTVEQRKGIGPASPDTLIAFGEALERLAAELNWGLIFAKAAIPMTAPRCWPECDFTVTQHSASKMWDWKNGRFKEEQPHSGDQVRLTWWRRDAGDRADVFTVDRNRARFTTTSRVVALVEAFRQINVPMYEQANGSIIRLPAEGNMPLHLARTFHIAALVAGGPVEVQGRWRYAYAATKQAIELVDQCLGPWFIRRDGTSSTSSDFGRMTSYAEGRSRHRNDRLYRVAPR